MIDGLAGILAGLSGVIIAIGTVLTQRGKRVELNQKSLVRDLQTRNTQYQVGLRHTARLERLLAANDLEVPERPVELHPDWGADSESSGQHRAVEA